MMQRPNPLQNPFVVFSFETLPTLDGQGLPPNTDYNVVTFEFDASGRVCQATLENGQKVAVDTSRPDHCVYYPGIADTVADVNCFNRQSCLNLIEGLYGFKETEYWVDEYVTPQSSLELLQELAIQQLLQENRPSEISQSDARRRKLDSIAYSVMFGKPDNAHSH